MLMHRSKYLLAVFLSLIFLAHVAIIELIGSCYAFAPDESLYYKIFSTTYTSTIYNHPEAWVEGSDLFFRIAFLPAKIFSYFPMVNELEAFRIGSVTYLVAGVLFTILAAKNSILPSSIEIRRLPRLFPLILPFLIPTFLIWGSLGLKENIIFFCFGLLMLGVSKGINKSKLVSNSLLSTGILILLNTKIYLAFISILALAFYYIYIWKQKSFRINLRYSAVKSLIPFLIPFVFQVAHYQQVYIPISTNQFQAEQQVIDNRTEYDSQGRTVALLQACKQSGTGGLLIRLASSRLKASLDNSYLPVKVRSGPIKEGRNIQPLNEFFTVLVAFLIFPRFWELPSSFFAQLQWLDSMIQFAVLVGAFFCIFRLRRFVKSWALFLTLNLIGIACFYSLVEVNFGTMSRHRIVLIPFVFAAYTTYLLAPAGSRDT